MNVRLGAVLLVAGFAFTLTATPTTSSPAPTRTGGPFDVKAITGEHRKRRPKEQLCYVCKYGAQARPAVVMIFTQKADENLATLVKAVDEVQKKNKDLGTVVVGVSGVADADFEKLQETHKLTTPLTIAVDKDGPAEVQAEQGSGRDRPRLQEGRQGRQELRVQGHQGRRRKGQGHRRLPPKKRLK